MSESEAPDYGRPKVQDVDDGWAWVEGNDDEVSDEMEDDTREGDLFTFRMCHLNLFWTLHKPIIR